MIIKTCKSCNEEFEAERSNRVYCSRMCANEVNNIQALIDRGAERGGVVRGKKYPNMSKAMNKKWQQEEYRKTMSEKHKGQHNSPKTEFKKGQTAPNKGKRINKIRGEKHWNWKGGCGARNMSTAEYKKWRENVFIRDNYTCQLCKKYGVYLEAHHIMKWSCFPDRRFDINNGATLCADCHNLTKSRVIWIVGNSGAGKTTLAKQLLKIKFAIHLDGDMVRGVWKDLGLSKEDRIENNLRVGRLVSSFKKGGHDLIVSTICPYKEIRDEIYNMTKCKFLYLPGGKSGEDYPFEIPSEEEKVKTISRYKLRFPKTQ
jgi:hypothetical protein